MKKLIIALLVAVMVPVFVACGASEDSDIDTASESSVSSVDSTEENKDEITVDNVEEKASEDTADSDDKKTETSTEEPTKESKADTTEATDDKIDTSSANGVDPELKKTLDEYEVFVDDFVEFMAPYKDMDMENADESVAGEFFMEYLAFATKYQETLTAFEGIDDDSLEGADKEYFEKVTARANQKLEETGFEDTDVQE